jgi:hypothetical protein
MIDPVVGGALFIAGLVAVVIGGWLLLLPPASRPRSYVDEWRAQHGGGA